MKRASFVLAVAGLLFGATEGFAHEGHGATPAHVHVDGAGGWPVDVGALGFAVATGVLALLVARRRAR